MKRAALLVAALTLGCAKLSGGFPCERSSECVLAGIQGTCEGTGYCSFPDPTCASGDRYGAAAPGNLAGACVGAAGTDAGRGGPDGGDVGLDAARGAIRTVGVSSVARADAVEHLDLARPAATAKGTFLFVAVFSDDELSVVTPPEGFTTLGDRADGVAFFHAWWFYKVAGASEPARYTFDVSPSQIAAGGLVALANVDPELPFDATSDALVDGPPFAAPSLDIASEGSTLLAAYVVDEGLDEALFAPAGMTEEVDVGLVGIYTEPLATFGQTGQRVAASTETAATRAGVAVAIVRRAP